MSSPAAVLWTGETNVYLQKNGSGFVWETTLLKSEDEIAVEYEPKKEFKSEFESESFYQQSELFNNKSIHFNRGKFKDETNRANEMDFLSARIPKDSNCNKNSDTQEKEKEEEEHRPKPVAEQIQFQHIGTNPKSKMVVEQSSKHYWTYGPIHWNSYGYKKITFKNIYPNIDVVYQVGNGNPKTGLIKYSFVLHKGAKVQDIQFQFTELGSKKP